MKTARNEAPEGRPPPRFRFSLGMLMLTTFAFCMAATGGFYLIQTVEGDAPPPIVFMIFPVAAPAVLLVVVSVGRSAWIWWVRRRR